MIDFRYHLVSIIAVFLALAVGLVLGATALSGPAQSVLRREYAGVSHANSTLHKDNSALTNQVNADQNLLQVASPRLLDGLLPGQNVVLVMAPGANPKVASGVSAALHRAGATVTGTVQLTGQFMESTAKNENSLQNTAESLAANAGVRLPTQFSNSAVQAQQEAAQVLAASVLYGSGVSLSPSASLDILNTLSQANFITWTTAASSANTTAPQPAQLAVLVTPSGPPPVPSSGNSSEVMAVVAQELKAAGAGTVMAGDVTSIGPGSAIDLESNVSSADQVSTVDNADTEGGQIIVVWALRQALDKKPPAAYGIVTQAVPTPAPTPSGSSSPSSTTRPGGHT